MDIIELIEMTEKRLTRLEESVRTLERIVRDNDLDDLFGLDSWTTPQ
jgi:hypothetical protein